MKKNLIIILILIFSVSCVTQKRCFKRFPPQSDTIRKTIIKDSIILRDTTIYFELPADTITDSIPIPCPEPPPQYIPDTARLESDFAVAKAWFSYPYIAIELIQKKSILEIRLDSAIRESYHWRQEYEKIKQVQKEKYIPGIYKIALKAWIGVFVALIIALILKKLKIW